MRKISLIFAFLFLTIAPGLLQATTIYLRDGQVLEGVDNLREFENIFLYQKNTRNISIPKERIQKIVDNSGETIFELLIRTMKARSGANQSQIFDFFINGTKVGSGEWYEEGKFRAKEGRVSDGKFIEYYPSGRVRREYMVANGTLNGTCKEYYASSIVERESTMRDGLEYGVSKNYHQNGNLKGESAFAAGEKDGETKLYYENGNLRSTMNFKAGMLVGSQKNYYENGNVQVEVTFENGIKHGPIRQFHEIGSIKMEGNFVKGELQGEVINYYESGRVRERLYFRNGRIIEG